MPRLAENKSIGTITTTVLGTLIIAVCGYYASMSMALQESVHGHDIVLAGLQMKVDTLLNANKIDHEALTRKLDEIQRFIIAQHTEGGQGNG